MAVHRRPRLQHLPVAASTQAVKPDIGSESRFLLTPPAFDPPLGGFPSEYCYAVWHGKTRMAWLPDGEKILMICLFVLTWSTIWCWIIPWPWNWGYTSSKVIQSGTIRQLRCGFTVSYSPSIVTMALSCVNSEIKRDISRKSWFFIPTLYSMPPLGRFPSEYCLSVSHGKTRIMGLPDAEKSLRIWVVLTECTNVTDRQTPHDGKGRAWC